MHPLFLGVHSWIRWILIITALLLLFRSILGQTKNRPFDRSDEALSQVFFWALNVQLIVGLLLLFVFSPLFKLALQDMSAAMSDSSIRYFIVEHPIMMLLAVGAGHAGISRSKKAEQSSGKHKAILIGVGVCLLLMLMAIPWPNLPFGRPLFFLP